MGDSHRFRKCAIGDPENRPPPTSIAARPSPTAFPGQRCGAENGNLQCPAGLCCSHAGYCVSQLRRPDLLTPTDHAQGYTTDFCSVPWNCQREYGWCDSAESPNGYNLANEPRPKIGQVPYGTLITTCTTPNAIALTYDDGPSNNTEKLLEILKKHDAKATFFVAGITNGKGEIDHEEKWVKTIRRMVMEGHQVGSHTWSHADIENMTSPTRRSEIAKNERAMVNILNKYPTYMRPPYVKCSNTTSCLSDVNTMGYHAISYSLDSTDWMHSDDLNAMKAAFDDALNKTAPDGNMLLIQHDTIRTSSIDLTNHVLDAIKRRGWKGEYPAPFISHLLILKQLSQLETASRITPKTGIECPNGPLHLQWPKMAVLSQALAFAEDWISSRTAWNATKVRRNATSKQQIARMQRPTTKGTKTLGHAS